MHRRPFPLALNRAAEPQPNQSSGGQCMRTFTADEQTLRDNPIDSIENHFFVVYVLRTVNVVNNEKFVAQTANRFDFVKCGKLPAFDAFHALVRGDRCDARYKGRPLARSPRRSV